jgi:capsular polysaccharide biosynthesis protein
MDLKSGYRSSAADKETVDHFRRSVGNYKKIIIAVTLAAGLIGYVLNFIVARPLYESSAYMLLTQVAGQSSGYMQNNSLDFITSSLQEYRPCP